MKIQQQLNEYLKFSKKDRIAILIITCILLTAFLLPPFLNQTIPATIAGTDTAWISALRKLEKPASQSIAYEQSERKLDGEYKDDRTSDRYNNGQQAQLFSFDPNTLDDAGWKRLGVKDKTIVTIRKYLEKGGRFKQAEDLRRIYGLRPGEADRLIPYISIIGQATGITGLKDHVTAPLLSGNTAERGAFRPSRVIRPVDINTADSLTFESLPGIGPTLASRIIRFREKLGGFYDIDQVSETFGISDSTFGVIKPYLQINKEYLPQKIPVNTVDLNSLRKHPYIKYHVAAAIINYRSQHGLFNSAEDLKQVAAIDPLLLERITPYLSFTQ